MAKLRVAVYCAAGCGGCDISLLEIHERLPELLEAADVVFWPTVMDAKYADVEAMPDGSIDACLFNGAVRTEENLHVARLLRAKSRVLMALGACAAWGGIPGLANLDTVEEILTRSFLTTESSDNPDGVLPKAGGDGDGPALPRILPKVRALTQVVEVDYVVPGCPPEHERVWEIGRAHV